MFETTLINFTNNLVSEFGENSMFEVGPTGCVGKEKIDSVFSKSKGLSAPEITDSLVEALNETDELAEAVVEEYIEWLEKQDWITNHDFGVIISHSIIRNYVGGYRIVDGMILNSEQIDD